MGEEWRLRLVGPLDLRRDGVPVPIAAAKQRVLVAALGLAAGEPVTVDRLITCLWGDQPPRSARNTLQNHVLRLRRTLHLDADSELLVSSAAGYRLDVDPDAVDVHQFRSLVRSARSAAMVAEPESAAALLDEALKLWRAEPLADVFSDVLHREVVPGLVEQRATALEQRIDLDLDRGRHAELVTELVALTTEHPLRERSWAQLMLALYRSGRAAEALDAYARASKALNEELGVDPGPDLRAVHQAVLTDDPSLTTTAPAPRPTAPPRAVPRQLPPPSRHFVGRATELRGLDAASEASLTVISAIGGTAGIGKTALALRWGHLHADRFPDGQLYVNLRGFDPTGTPLPPMTAIHRFLAALDVPAHAVPADPDEQVALYRSKLAGRRMLLVLDNARDAEQVRPLLPGAPGCMVVVTSRDQLAGLVALDGAVPVTLDLLSRDEAHHLLVRRLGTDRVAREQAEVDELIDVCARLPLALNIAAARAALHPNLPLAAFVRELRDAHRQLDALTTGEAAADVRAVFSWSYRTLTPVAAHVFRLLGLHPGPDISLPAVASLTGHEPDATRQALDELTRAHLIIEQSPARYTLHDLLRAYAAEQVLDNEPERQAALRRVIDFYTHTACGAESVLNPNRTPLQLDPPAPGAQPLTLPDPRAALAWLDAECTVLLSAQQTAAAHGWHANVWQLAWGTNELHTLRGHYHDHVTMWAAALSATAHLPDPSTRVFAHRRLGSALVLLDRHDEGIVHLRQAVALAEAHHDLKQLAPGHQVLSWAWDQQNNHQQALEHALRFLDVCRELGAPVQEADALDQVGWCLAQLGDFDAARTHCEAARTILRSHHDPAAEATTLDSLGYILHKSGQHEQAIEHFQLALSRYTDLGHIPHTAATLDRIGHPYVALGDPEQARTVWRKSQDLYRQQGNDEAVDRIQRQIDDLDE